jgi:hypothetical protein
MNVTDSILIFVVMLHRADNYGADICIALGYLKYFYNTG